MRDGSILLKGKGNEDCNYSAPHGVGRLMSSIEARKNINIKDFKKSMKKVNSSSVSMKPIDEAPTAYKDPKDIFKYTCDTADLIDSIRPLYNFKA